MTDPFPRMQRELAMTLASMRTKGSAGAKEKEWSEWSVDRRGCRMSGVLLRMRRLHDLPRVSVTVLFAVGVPPPTWRWPFVDL